MQRISKRSSYVKFTDEMEEAMSSQRRLDHCVRSANKARAPLKSEKQSVEFSVPGAGRPKGRSSLATRGIKATFEEMARAHALEALEFLLAPARARESGVCSLSINHLWSDSMR
jgi:hypothetical protein